VIFAANHTSHLDTPAIFTALPSHWRGRLTPAMAQDHFLPYFEPQRFSRTQAWESGLEYFFACAIYNTYPLPQQMSGARRALRYTGDLLSRGYCPVVFPEGARTPDGAIHTFRPGIGMMAVRLRVPVVPIRICGLFEIYSIHDSWPRRGRVHISIGRPLEFSSDTSYEDAAHQLEETLKRM
jgi:long-chain acyl-CoA synthetase